MLTTSRRLVRRLFANVGLVEHLLAPRAANARKKRPEFPRLQLTPLEERILLDASSVGILWIEDAAEPTAPGTFRLTRAGDAASLAAPLTVSLHVGGTATRGDDYQFDGTTGTGQDLSVTFDA